MNILNKISAKLNNFLDKKIERMSLKQQAQELRATKNKIERTQYSRNFDVGIYFMDLEQYTSKRYDIIYKHELETYYLILGLACQGRIEEIEDVYRDEVENVAELLADYIFNDNDERNISKRGGLEDKYLKFLKEIKPRVMKMAKIAEKVDNMEMNDLKDGESIGAWQSRKLKGYKTFMNEFEYFKKYDVEKFLKSIHK